VLHATVYLGVNRIRNWIRMIAISGLQDCPTELLKFALIRGRMCELLAAKLPNDQREMAFTVGLFSLLDALLNTPMDDLLSRIPLTDEIRNALVKRTGPLRAAARAGRGVRARRLAQARGVRVRGRRLRRRVRRRGRLVRERVRARRSRARLIRSSVISLQMGAQFFGAAAE
jgi:hypothetical protein